MVVLWLKKEKKNNERKYYVFSSSSNFSAAVNFFGQAPNQLLCVNNFWGSLPSRIIFGDNLRCLTGDYLWSLFQTPHDFRDFITLCALANTLVPHCLWQQSPKHKEANYCTNSSLMIYLVSCYSVVNSMCVIQFKGPWNMISRPTQVTHIV
jgi:hypothetical protein